jgi:predicted DNA-binding transcriptional regulator AlpA
VLPVVERVVLRGAVVDPHPNANGPLAVDAREAARLLGVGRSTFLSRVGTGAAPPPVKIGKRSVWSVATLSRWLDAGCPSADRFREMERERR